VVNTLLFLSAKLFLLRGGHELRSLSHDQIQFEEKQDGSMCVTYKEKVSKQRLLVILRLVTELNYLQDCSLHPEVFMDTANCQGNLSKCIGVRVFANLPWTSNPSIHATETGISSASYATLALKTLRSRLCCRLHNTPQLAPAGIFTEA
jgi:hypothetical protein